jgi:hypothetical protein
MFPIKPIFTAIMHILDTNQHFLSYEYFVIQAIPINDSQNQNLKPSKNKKVICQFVTPNINFFQVNKEIKYNVLTIFA